jgi:OmpA-OmpF porin, OOP family
MKSTVRLRVLQLLLSATTIAAVVLAFPAAAKDIAGAKDHPLIKRYEGSTIAWYQQKNFDALRVLLEPVVFDYGDGKYAPYKKLDVKGRKTTIFYAIPQGIGTLEAVRQYENDLRERGFEVLFSASGDGLERNKGDNVAAEIYGVTPQNSNRENPDKVSLTGVDRSKSHYAAAKLTRAEEGDVYATVFAFEATERAAPLKVAEGQTVVRLDVLEVKPMQQKMVTVDAAEMERQISANGRVALYGILFDFNKADVKPESEQALAEIAKLLKSRTTLNVLVVGHTDAVGNFESNRTLSQRRAEAIVRSLTSKHGIEKQRLFPVGVSYAAPVATNTTDEGRAKNRRVELVEMPETK